jgi:carbon storage regulator CsrA
MLILKAKRYERIRIGDNVYIHVTRTDKGGAYIAFDAPDHVKILRDRAIRKEAKQENQNDGDH